jgi:hypothetical protein
MHPVEPERWNLFYQATSIGDEHGTFHAPYGGPLSLADYPEHDVSLTSTLFFSVRLEQTPYLWNVKECGDILFAELGTNANLVESWSVRRPSCNPVISGIRTSLRRLDALKRKLANPAKTRH